MRFCWRVTSKNSVLVLLHLLASVTSQPLLHEFGIEFNDKIVGVLLGAIALTAGSVADHADLAFWVRALKPVFCSAGFRHDE